jgi:hypothetical protein
LFLHLCLLQSICAFQHWTLGSSFSLKAVRQILPE